MAMQGNLKDMAVADLIQHTCQDRKTARVLIDHDDQTAALFFKDGALVHATLDDLQGEEVVYRILGWEQGQFKMETNAVPPTVTITKSWSGLLLEGARRIDESDYSDITRKEKKPMATKKTSELIADVLSDLLSNSADIEGAAVVGTDGLVYSVNVPSGKVDENMVGAVAAAALGLSKRSTEQLRRGNFNQTLVQGDKGNIVITSLNLQTLFVGLTPANVNLGMAFAETRQVAAKLRDLLA